MASDFEAKPPVWFWVLVALFILWGLAGCGSLYAHIAYGPKLDPAATEWDYAYFAALPGWFVWDYALAVGGGLSGAIALALRSKLARPLFIASLIGVVVQFGYVFLATDLIAHKGFWVVYFPAFILAMALVQIWFAGMAAERGWIS